MAASTSVASRQGAQSAVMFFALRAPSQESPEATALRRRIYKTQESQRDGGQTESPHMVAADPLLPAEAAYKYPGPGGMRTS